MKILLIFGIVIFSHASNAQDSMAYVLHKNRVILYTDFGFNAAPFKLEDSYLLSQSQLKFKHNLKPVLGIGINYKWFALRLGFGLPGSFRPVSRFGRSSYFDLGTQFTIKKTYCMLDLRNYGSYVIVDANKWNDTLNDLIPNDFRPNTKTASLSVNVFYFFSKDIHMKSIFGTVGYYTKNTGSWYLRNTLNFFGISNNGETLVPTELVDTLKHSTEATAITALDIGTIPGYVYIHKYNHWQFSVFGGLGAVIQSKFFVSKENTRDFLGFAPRVDFRFTAGYNLPDYFINLVSDFDIKSIRVQKASYGQIFYSLKLVGGIRLKEKTKKVKEKALID